MYGWTHFCHCCSLVPVDGTWCLDSVYVPHIYCKTGNCLKEDVNYVPVSCFRHSRAYLHALFKSDTAAMHHITIHNIAYQVSIKNVSLTVNIIFKKTKQNIFTT